VGAGEGVGIWEMARREKRWREWGGGGGILLLNFISDETDGTDMMPHV
jgi:hypothetical protein